MRRAFADGRVLAAVHGSPPWRVLCLPGWMHTAADFDGLAAALGPGVGVLAVDLPGFGGLAPEPPAVWGAAEYASWVAPLLHDSDGELADRLVLVGHSRGGAVAVRLAVDHPDRVGALVLTGVPLVRLAGAVPTRPPIGYRMVRALHRRGLVSDARMERLRRRSGSADYRAASGVMRDILVKVTNETYDKELAALASPVELVWGADDDEVAVAVAEHAASLINEPASATLTLVPGVGHLVPTSATGTAALADAVRDHLHPRPGSP